jgi:hypothetical protein
MSLDQPQKNKMMTAPPVKKGFHFASDGIYLAEFIEAQTIEEAEAIYHQTKRLIAQPSGTVDQPTAPLSTTEQQERTDSVQ